LATSVVNELVSALNLKVALLPETQTNQGTADTITSGGLSVSFSLPSNLSLSLDCNSLGSEFAQLNILCQTPNELEGLNFTFTIGRVTASALATPPFSLSLGLPVSSLPSPTSAAGLTTGVTSSPIFGTQPDFGTQSDLGTQPVSTTTPTAAAAPERRSTGLLAVGLSSPVGAGLLAVLIAVAIAFGLGLRRLATGMALAKPDESCPLEERP
jgi:hypothetical protein